MRAWEADIPCLGFGTWKLTGDTAREMTGEALSVGYRHIDTARIYGNEGEIGRALERSRVAREEVFLATKIWPDDYRPEDFRSAVEDSLECLRTGYVDLLLLHWPYFEEVSLEETLGALARVRAEGLTRHLGVCNFNRELLARAWEISEEPIAVNQVEYHPHLTQEAILEAVRGRDMVLTAYCPLANGRLAGGPDGDGPLAILRTVLRRIVRGPSATLETLGRIGARHGKSPAQVVLRWLIQQDSVSAIPRTSNPDHLRENIHLFDFQLSEEEMDRISSLYRPDGRIFDPPQLAPDWD